MPFMDWRLVTYTMALPDESKSFGGYTKVIARRAMEGQMPELIRLKSPEGRFQFSDAKLAEWTAFRLDGFLAPSKTASV